jgi:hypothetical protein
MAKEEGMAEDKTPKEVKIVIKDGKIEVTVNGKSVPERDRFFAASWTSSADTAALLGLLIFALNPYKAVEPQDWERPGATPIIPYPDKSSGAGVYRLCTNEIETHAEPGNWSFKGSPHYIERAVRIPYMYYKKESDKESDKEPAVLIKDYFLIGFEGGGAY